MRLSKFQNSHETSPLLPVDDRNAGGSAVDGVALHRNERDGQHIFAKFYYVFEVKISMQEIMERHMITFLETNDK